MTLLLLLLIAIQCFDTVSYVTSKIRAVLEFGSDSGRNLAFFTNPADIRFWPKLGQI